MTKNDFEKDGLEAEMITCNEEHSGTRNIELLHDARAGAQQHPACIRPIHGCVSCNGHKVLTSYKMIENMILS
jgi:hypothetical protein